MSGQDDVNSGLSQADNATQTSQYTLTEFQLGDILAERFRLEELLGVGGMGLVYKAHDIELNTPVALKLLRPELTANETSLQRFRNELLLARQISHPNVIRLHELMRHHDHWFITMDYVQGESLDRLIDRERKLSVEQATDITRQIALGLAAANQMHVVHRDLKPANILLDRQGKVFISDFGVARSLASSPLTQHGAMVGTPDYLSPEQAAGETVDHRSDLYTLGVMLCEMLTGKLPYTASTPTELLSQKLVSSPDPVDLRSDDIPAWLRNVCAQLMKRTPGHRLQTAEELVHALDNPESYKRRRRGRLARYAAAGVMVLAAAWFGWQQWAPESDIPEAVQPAQAIDHGITILPFSSAATAQISNDQAAAMSFWVSQALLNNLNVSIQPPYRTETILKQLGYQPLQAREHLDQINELSGHERSIAGHITQRDDNAWLTIELLEKQELDWQTEIQLAADSQQWQQQINDATQALHQHIIDHDINASAPDEVNQVWQSVTISSNIDAVVLAYQGLYELTTASILKGRELLQSSVELDPQLSASWLALSVAQVQSGNWESAFTSAERATATLPENDERLKVFVDAWNAQLEGNYELAIQTFQEYLEDRGRDDEASLVLAQIMGAAGQFDPAIELLRTVIRDDPNHPRGWYELAKVSIQSGRARIAIDDYLIKALVIQNRLRNRQGQADVTNAMGVAYERLGQLDQAVTHYRQAAELRAAVNDTRGHATTLRNLASILAIQGDTDSAEAYLRQAQTSLESMGESFDLADLHNAMGVLEEERGNYTEALNKYREALRMRQSLNDPQGIAQSQTNIGFIYYELDETDNALVYWLQARDKFEEIGDRSGQAQTLQLIALLHIASGELDEARTLLQQALELAEANQLSDEIAAVTFSLAEVMKHSGQYTQALGQLDKAMSSYQQRADRRGLLEASMLAAQIYNELNSPENSTGYLMDTPINSSDNPDQQFRFALISAISTALLQRQQNAATPSLSVATGLVDAEKNGALQLALTRAEIALLNPDNDSIADTIVQMVPDALAQSEWKLIQTAFWLTARFHARRGDSALLQSTLNRWRRQDDELPGNIWPLRRQLLQQQYCAMIDNSDGVCADMDTQVNNALETTINNIPASQHQSFLRSVWIPEHLANSPMNTVENHEQPNTTAR